jgi:CubicO group peptidase (beta-lactamase class C family)
VDKLARPIVADGRAVGISVGVLDETGGTHFFGYGKLATDGEAAPDADTLFEIGSITKCFTAVLLADMVHKGEVRLEDPAERYVPEGVRLPRVAGRAITLEDLATYSSGLPRMPDNIGDDFAHYPARKDDKVTR